MVTGLQADFLTLFRILLYETSGENHYSHPASHMFTPLLRLSGAGPFMRLNTSLPAAYLKLFSWSLGI